MNTKKGKYSLEKLSGVWAVMMAGRYVLETFSTEGHAAHALRGYEVGKRFVKEKQNVWVVDDAYVLGADLGGVQLGEVSELDLDQYNITERLTQDEFDSMQEEFL